MYAKLSLQSRFMSAPKAGHQSQTSLSDGALKALEKRAYEGHIAQLRTIASCIRSVNWLLKKYLSECGAHEAKSYKNKKLSSAA